MDFIKIQFEATVHKGKTIAAKILFDILPFCHFPAPHCQSTFGPHMPQKFVIYEFAHRQAANNLQRHKNEIPQTLQSQKQKEENSKYQSRSLYKQNTWKCTGNKQQQIII